MSRYDIPDDFWKREHEMTRQISVMQPYFLPYLGYWQLIAAADIFVLLDDVNFIVRGYINRNTILVNGRGHLFSLPVADASQNRLIKETKLNFPPSARSKLLKTIAAAYKKAPRFSTVFPLLESIVLFSENDLTKYIRRSLLLISGYLGLDTEFLLSSALEKDESKKGQSRIIEICLRLEAEMYVNSPGGRDLYDPAEFRRHGLTLRFLRPGKVVYPQFNQYDFIPNLSIIDVMMFNDVPRIGDFLKEYTLDEK
jgi:hypothetical protein